MAQLTMSPRMASKRHSPESVNTPSAAPSDALERKKLELDLKERELDLKERELRLQQLAAELPTANDAGEPYGVRRRAPASAISKSMTKVCPKCGLKKNVLAEFGVVTKRGVVRPQGWCRTCRSTTNYHGQPRLK